MGFTNLIFVYPLSGKNPENEYSILQNLIAYGEIPLCGFSIVVKNML